MTSRSSDTSSATRDEQLERALGLAYAYLNRRERTVSEVRSRLQTKGISAELTEAAIGSLSELGYLDDARFAQLFVSDKRELEQWGSERIRRGLLARGIERELAERALAGGADRALAGAADRGLAGAADRGLAGADGDQVAEETELDRALAVLARRFPAPPSAPRERERALGVLLRKGYESELALDALRAYARES
ncbi:MAG TPA: regulatory protein RecX [Solirubrobacteraceae bacterium]|jgi:regulatory protein